VAASFPGSVIPPPATGAKSILDAPKTSSDLGANVRTLQHFFVVSNKVIDYYKVFLEL
jgi:hypothetical protein